jgi:hypothetical protein
MNGTSSRIAFAEGEPLNPDWSTVARWFAVMRRGGLNAVRICRIWQLRRGRVRLPRVSADWLLELEVTSNKHRHES